MTSTVVEQPVVVDLKDAEGILNIWPRVSSDRQMVISVRVLVHDGPIQNTILTKIPATPGQSGDPRVHMC